MPQPEDLTQAELAKRLGISDKAVRNLHGREAGGEIFPRLENGLYPWPAARDWYIRFKQEEVDRRRESGRALELRDEQARLTKLKGDIAELDLGQLRRVLYHVRDVGPMLRLPLEQVDAALRNAPARYAAELAAAANIPVAAAMRILEDIIEPIRADLRNARDRASAFGTAGA